MSANRRPRDESAVLVFRIGSLGDTVVALPAFHEIRRQFPQSRIVLLTNTPVDGGIKAISSTHVLAGIGLVDDSIEYPHGSLSLRRILGVIRQIRALGPRVCYFLLASRTPGQAMRDRIFFWLSGIREIRGLGPAEMHHQPPHDNGTLWESEAKRALRAIGSKSHQLRLEDFSLLLTREEREVAQRVVREGGIAGPFIVISLGSKVPVKDWGDQRWSECLRNLGPATAGTSMVAIGSKDEVQRSSEMLRFWPWRTANLCGQLTPRQSAAVIERAKLFIGHDSGPMHLASAVGTPTLAIFSARAMPGIWFPFGQEHNVFYKDVPCRGCGLEVCVENKQRCVTEIVPADVVNRALEVLSSSDSIFARTGGLRERQILNTGSR